MTQGQWMPSEGSGNGVVLCRDTVDKGGCCGSF